MGQTITEAERTKIYDDLADLMIDAVERDDLPFKEMKQSCTYILETLDTIKTEEELLEFLRTLGEKWKTYAIELVRYEGQKKEVQDQAKIQEIQSKLANFLHA
ncbi:hypothetical protein A2334_00800 [Candidatus Roizmanbacteria bacterium RIFOXYB2_FULL_38_10]|uniref:Uncharacterized protein n=1 Tax=Candidatus Roizmanbacteria bacterium RIFOXYD1_FULL_38_12 TaxID=1802093 RepID=A0A1F7L1C4_9BACT|nr:MAG: hypothetical protein A3K47_04095 [Candidatus Roizmanbacteria bacterium RIFOXYA2_FULL_38_14]OGK63939.1 MAG: hypothetical protein A3K27_04095 [Candidatus Roizmanbacteria bacterium RIFOXYA1_FULL_37_12]OGK65785.1 MAG: hypothetical protein A3K38_04095 [Candidatus Roizmanbacteria bacterium RIFOXYB1_FULL_40_23]OGK68893.1 MAG: hypothetical protein A2334_00800 [Candidatus Roizmanbacteria bacterium RIFOXYB2_FULL_38_10]OGK70190.1 MAG: hypothetical protein A3K21_04100 [Candidatus Roizmanbacteria ba